MVVIIKKELVYVLCVLLLLVILNNVFFFFILSVQFKNPLHFSEPQKHGSFVSPSLAYSNL